MAEQCDNYDDKLAEYTCPCCQKGFCIDCWEANPHQIKTCDVCEQRVCPDCIININSVTGYSWVCKNCNDEYLPALEAIKEQAI